jgi:hypothetical protein
MSTAVIPSRCPQVSMASRILYILERHASLASTGDERNPPRVRTDLRSVAENQADMPVTCRDAVVSGGTDCSSGWPGRAFPD